MSSRQMSPSPLAIACLALPLFASCGGELDWFVVETEVQELCIVDMSTDFPGAPQGIIANVFGGDELGGLTLGEDISASMFLQGVGISTKLDAQNSVDSFDFIDTLRVEVTAEGMNSAELLNFATDAETGDKLFVPVDSAVDIAAYLESPSLELMVEFSGELPTSDWTANMEVCVTAEAAYRESI